MLVRGMAVLCLVIAEEEKARDVLAEFEHGS
jgi:hypothetical protein